jgi:hypothetical protein
MLRQYCEPLRSDYDCDSDYFEALGAWDNEQALRAAYLENKRAIHKNQTR